MGNIKNLIKKLNELTKGKDDLFAESGMVNSNNAIEKKHTYGCLDYGFFPYGSGRLINDFDSKTENVNFKEGGIMFLGNDFGDENYLIKCLVSNSENTSNPTIRNILTKFDLNLEDCFFTNLHLGVRNNNPTSTLIDLNISNKKISNVVRGVSLKQDFINLCIDVLKIQIKVIKPKYIVCLGNDVRKNLIKYKIVGDKNFADITFKKLHENKLYSLEINNIKFIPFPHPSDLRNIDENLLIKLKFL